jgi:hypothetical protein
MTFVLLNDALTTTGMEQYREHWKAGQNMDKL